MSYIAKSLLDYAAMRSNQAREPERKPRAQPHTAVPQPQRPVDPTLLEEATPYSGKQGHNCRSCRNALEA